METRTGSGFVRGLSPSDFSEAEGVTLNVPGLYHPDDLPAADERNFPTYDDLPDVDPLHEYNYTDSFIPIDDYMLARKKE